MSIATMKKQTAATYRTSLTGSRGNSSPGIFSTVGRYRKLGGVQTQHSPTPFIPIKTAVQVHKDRTLFARRPAPFSVARVTPIDIQSQQRYIEERAELERRRLQLEANRTRMPQIADGCACAYTNQGGLTDTSITYAQYYRDRQAVCQLTQPLRGVLTVCGHITEPLCPPA
jgi:hypothetical protein